MPILTLETLNGPPKIGGIVFPNAQSESPVEGIAIDESRYKTLANGSIKLIGQERYRLRWALGWKVLSPENAETLKGIIEQKEGFTFTPRTIKPGVDTDPSAQESVYTVRLVSDIILSKPLRFEDFEVYIELETTGIING